MHRLIDSRIAVALCVALLAPGSNAQQKPIAASDTAAHAESRSAACLKSGRASGKATSPEELVRAAFEHRRGGKVSQDAWQAVAAEWCLTRLSDSAAASVTASSESDDAAITWVDLYYSGETNHYYAVADYSWNDGRYRLGSWPILDEVAVGGRDGFGVRVGGNLSNAHYRSYAAVWGNPALNSCDYDYGFLELRDNNAWIRPNEHGVFYYWQDKIKFAREDYSDSDCWADDIAGDIDYNSYGGTVLYQFDIVTGECRYERAWAEYWHTWSTTDITGVRLGWPPFPILSSNDHQFPAFGDSGNELTMCANRAYGDVDPVGHVVIPPDGSDTGGTASTAEPAMVYDQNDGTMKIYRWYSTDSSFPRLSDYESGSFHLSRVGDRAASGDVDGDGDDDIVMAYENGDGTFAFHVFKSGSSWAGKWYTSGQFDLGPVGGRLVVDDFNGDGLAEPALARDNGTTMTIYRWLSTGSSFYRAEDYHSGSFDLANVGDRMASGDVNNDGRADIVMAYQNGDGTFSFHVFNAGSSWAGKWYTSGPFSLGPVAGRLVVADFTGDGRAEPALVRDGGDTMKIYRWSSTGSSFSRAADYQSGTFRLSRVGDRVASGDVDGDGRADIVTSYQKDDGTHALHVFPSGASWGGIWYTGGQYNLDNVSGRLIVGKW